jgi:hypothetical protein
MKSTSTIAAALAILTVGVGAYIMIGREENAPDITSFEECAEAFAVQETFPPRCVTPDGQMFIGPFTGYVKNTEAIRVPSGQLKDPLSSPITVTGEARGYWFFEASFPMRVEDSSGEVLGGGIATAGSEWMTESFVPFSGTITFSRGTNTQGFLVLMRDNPSGLPENDAELRIPVEFK